MKITNTKPVFHKALNLSGILAEVAAVTPDRPMMPERAEWFRAMLRNAIGNAEQDIRFLASYDGWTEERKAQSIATKRDRIARCSEALTKIA